MSTIRISRDLGGTAGSFGLVLIDLPIWSHKRGDARSRVSVVALSFADGMGIVKSLELSSREDC